MNEAWQHKIVPPEVVLSKVKPGTNIFLGTGVAEPRTLIKHLMASNQSNLRDLEFIQLLSLGDAIPLDERYADRYRLKTFFSGKRAREAITSGRVDLIPSLFSQIPDLFQREMIKVDAALIQITPPDRRGFCSLGVAVDVARYAIEGASLVIGEINEQLPRTFGDTFIHINDFHYLVGSTEPPIYFPRWHVDETFDKVAANVASVIEDGSCLAFFIGTLFEALVPHLAKKKDLGIHSLLLTDPVMDLIKSGAITNKRKETFVGKSLVAYAQGTPVLMEWLDNNPLVEFQRIDVVADPRNIGFNDCAVIVIPARKVDLAGSVALHAGRKNLTAGPSELQEFFTGAQISRGGCKIFALPSRNLQGEANILLTTENYPSLFTSVELIDMIVTEYGVAYLTGKTVRERALALIDIAHPDDRAELVRQAKELKILYPTQIYLSEVLHLYSEDISCTHAFNENITVHFRPIKPSDVDDMRRLFYRFSDQAIFYRYFSHVQIMPHTRMQDYISIDYNQIMSIVGVTREAGTERIIAEGRYVRYTNTTYADVAFIVDEKYSNMGIATFIFTMLRNIAKARGVEGFTAYIQTTNKPMTAIMEKVAQPPKVIPEEGLQIFSFPFHTHGC